MKRIYLLLAAACCALAALAVQAQSPQPSNVGVEPITPFKAALERGILFAPLEEGTVAPTTIFNPLLEYEQPYAGAVAIDNGGIKETGKYRLGGAAGLMNPFTTGDRLRFRGSIADETGTRFWQLSYQVPVGRAGTSIGVDY